MKLPAILSQLTAWVEGENVGKFEVMRSHKGSVGVGTQETIKMFEIDAPTATVITDLVNRFGALRINIICNVHNGLPDRIELFKFRG